MNQKPDLNLESRIKIGSKRKKNILATSLVVASFLVDRVGKWYFKDSPKVVLNSGSSFSLPIKINIYLAFSLLVICLIFWLRQKNNFYWLLILIGGLGNFWDRLIYGQVIDYLHFWVISLNLSDVLITLGVLWAIKLQIFQR